MHCIGDDNRVSTAIIDRVVKKVGQCLRLLCRVCRVKSQNWLGSKMARIHDVTYSRLII
jgi:hypothetical protein